MMSRRAARVVAALGTVLAVLAIAAGILWVGDSLQRLSSRLEALTRTQKAIDTRVSALEGASLLAASGPAGPETTGGATATARDTEAQTQSGTRRFGRITAMVEGSPTVELTFDGAQLLTGPAAVSAAAALGVAIQGDTYVLDPSTSTVSLSAPFRTPVIVYGWDGAGASEKTTITAAALAKAFADPQGPRLKRAYFTLTIREEFVTRIEQSLVR
ncbi:MAG: hypothetical protein C0418_01165 [Coriobacteriaceae bacterium]|nr:hypothetical protein [Coriobacteriaceae bacterium]